MEILTVVHKERISRKDKAKALVDGHKNDFLSLKPGDYALVKIEPLNDRIAVEEFIESLKNR